MNFFDTLFDDPLTILNPNPGAGGSLSWNRYPARGVRVIADESNTPPTGKTKLKLGTYYVVADVAPAAGGRIEDGSASYEITQVRRFYDPDGQLIAYRCSLD